MPQYQVRELNLTEIPVRRGQSIGSDFAASTANPTALEARVVVLETVVAALATDGVSRAKLRFVS